MMSFWIDHLITIVYFISILLFIFGLKAMSSPNRAKRGMQWAGIGMIFATMITFITPNLHNFWLITLAIFVGGSLSFWLAQKVKMTAMPQMIALFNGLGGGSAALISAVELIRNTQSATPHLNSTIVAISVLGAIIGSISFSGSIIAFLKLQSWMKKSIRFRGQSFVNLAIFLILIFLASTVWLSESTSGLWGLFLLALFLGIAMTIPIGGADMPVVISLYNALTGLAVAAEGFVLQNPAMIIAGTIVGAAGSLLTQLMAKAMHRSITNILFSHFGETAESSSTEGTMKAMDIPDAASMLAFSSKIIFVPGYGMAVAQAQYKVWELAKLLIARNISVKFAIHPVAGRMPGHMNVLLAEAGVPYDLIFDLEEINSEFATTDIAIVIGANDVVNPEARTNPKSPIYGMPILNVDQAQQVFGVKRGKGTGFSGVENPLFFLEKTDMLFGDAQSVMSQLIQAIKSY